MINGAHVILYSKDSEADRAFLRDVLDFPHVDVGGGWLIFGLPPAEVAVHPAEESEHHALYLMCEDVNALVDAMRARGIETSPIEDQGWGLLTALTLPGGGTLGVYEPRHARPKTAAPRGARKARASRRAAKPAARRARAKATKAERRRR